MSMDRIREAVIEEAEEKAQKIESEARARCEERLEQGKEQIEQEFQQKFEEQRQKIERTCERRLIQERSKHNLALLEKRNEILDRLFEQAAERIFKLPEDEYRELIGSWIAEIPGDTSGTVICHTDDAERIRPLIDDLNAGRNENTQLEVEEGERPERGGVIFRTGKFEIDMSVERRINDLRDELAPTIAQKVFPDGLKV